jgi:hypothetical protein
MSIIFSHRKRKRKKKKGFFYGRRDRANPFPLMKKDKTMKTTKMTGGIETQVAAGGPSKT